MRPLAIFLTLAAFTVWATAAKADDLADEADLHFQLGAEAYRAGQYRVALEHFLLSNRLVQNGNSAFNIGRTYERLNAFPEAYRAYTSALELEQSAESRAATQNQLDRIRPKVALIQVDTDPPGATIYLDRKDLGPRGDAPRLLAVSPGEYRVIVEMPGFNAVQSNAHRVLAGHTARVTLNLSPLRGIVKVEADPAVVVALKGVETPLDCRPPCALSLPAGPQTIVLSKRGHVSEELEITVPAEQTVVLRPVLQPLLGSLVVNTDEAGARIEVDGTPIGFSPNLTKLAVGHHVVTVSKPGYKRATAPVSVVADRETRLDLELIRSDQVTAASRHNEEVEDAPASISLVGAEEIRALAYPTIAEALKGRPGVTISDDSAYVSLGIRGLNRPGSYGNRILVLQDGMAANDNWLGSSYVSYDAMTDLGDVERLELVRGPGSVYYGNSAFSGVINVVTRDVKENAIEAHVDNSSPNVARARVRGDWVLGSGATAWMSLSGAKSQSSDVFIPEYANVTPPGSTPGVARNTDSFDAGTLRGRLQWHWLTASYFYHSRSKQFPGAQFDTIFGDPQARQRDTRGFLELKAEPHISSSIHSLTRLHINRYAFKGFYPHTQDHGGLEIDTYHGHWLGAEQRFTHRLTRQASLIWGGEFQWHFDVSQTTRDSTGYLLNQTGDHSKPFTASAAYLLVEGQVARNVRVSLGNRLDHYSTFGDSVNPRLAIMLHPWQSGILKFMGGRAFRAPSVYELYYNDGNLTQVANPELKPEVTYSAEAEYLHRLLPTVQTAWSVWANTVQHLIDTRTVENGTASPPEQYVNTEKPIAAWGTDISIRRDWRQGWMIEANYGWQHAAFLQGTSLSDLLALKTANSDHHVSNYPAQNFGLRAVMPILLKQLRLGSRLTYVDKRWTRYSTVSNESQVQTGNAVLWDMVLSGDESRFGLGYHVGVYNLFDWRYSLPVGFEFDQRTMPQRGRSFIAGLTWSH